MGFLRGRFLGDGGGRKGTHFLNEFFEGTPEFFLSLVSWGYYLRARRTRTFGTSCTACVAIGHIKRNFATPSIFLNVTRSFLFRSSTEAIINAKKAWKDGTVILVHEVSPQDICQISSDRIRLQPSTLPIWVTWRSLQLSNCWQTYGLKLSNWT